MATNRTIKQGCLAGLTLIIGFTLTGCHGNNPPAEDPAQVNQAPVGAQMASTNQTEASSETAPAQAPAPAPAPEESQPESSNYSSDNSYPQNSENEAAEQAPQPPPPLPEYNQPPCPDPNYMWTPGYWAWGQDGYYWAPGVWVAAPYEGALWTPGYWGYSESRYFWHPGYWGPHIGFYGGINYGFGYIGVGFLGGFWSNNGFHYNRAVTNVNTTTITNVYNYTVTNNVIINNTRVAYNGGSGGVGYQPSAAELAAGREPHVRALPAQVEVVRAAATNRAQFASVNRGRPQLVAMAAPVAVQRIRPPVGAVNPGIRGAVRPAPALRAPTEAGPAVPAGRPAEPASRPVEPAPERRAESPSNPPSRTEPRPEVARPAQSAERPAPRAAERPASRPAQEHPAARPQEPPAEPQARKAPPPRKAAPEEKKPEQRPEQQPPL